MVFEQVMEQLGLAARPQQTALVSLARSAVHGNAQRLVQAGTGTGKSYAVLSVALEAARITGLPSLVVCPNNTLIDQYIKKDAPRVWGVAGGKFVHIKGRSRYVCATSFALRGQPKEYLRLVSGGTYEWAELGLDESYGCPGSKRCNPRNTCVCGAFEDDRGWLCQCPKMCGIYEARAEAETADVVITNAHVLVWDLLVQQMTGGNVRLLPDRGALFVDECHELEGVGRDCVSDEIGAKSLVYSLVPGLRNWVDEIADEMVRTEKTEYKVTTDPQIQQMVDLARVDMATNSHDPETCDRLRRFVNFATPSSEFVSMVTVFDDKVKLVRRCVDVRSMFRKILTDQPSVLVSGTIPSSDRRRLGLDSTKIVRVGHPFDYSKSTLIVSKFDPKSKTDAVYRVKSVIRAINDTKGGTLVLFTSWADLETVMPKVAQGLDDGIDVYMQSREDPATLRQDVIDFESDGNAVLAGVRSLFTGLDIPGSALRQLIVWKLPYQVPTLEVEAISKLFGRGVYRDQMLMVLVQGVGRLIRKDSDQGRVLIMDVRAKELDWSNSGMTEHLGEFGT